MSKYIVNIEEVWIQPVEICAENESEARKKVLEGEGEYQDNNFEFSHVINEEDWQVETK